MRITMVGCWMAVAAFAFASVLAPENVSATGSQRPGRSPIPERIAAAPGLASVDAWISASELTHSGGQLRREAFTGRLESWIPSVEHALAETARTSAMGQAPCFPIGPVHAHVPGGPRPEDSLADLFQRADSVAYGTVTGIDGGFYMETRPGLLVEVEVHEWLKGSETAPEASYVYFHYPAGEFAIGPARVCVVQSGWPDPPELGDPILLFPQSPPWDVQGIVLSIDSRGWDVAFESPRGLGVNLRLQRLLERFEIDDFTELRTRATSSLRQRRIRQDEGGTT